MIWFFIGLLIVGFLYLKGHKAKGSAPSSASSSSSQKGQVFDTLKLHSDTEKNVIVPEGYTKIIYSAKTSFLKKAGFLESITLPSTLIKICDSAFENCPKLMQIDFSRCHSLKVIEQFAFAGCEKITEIILPDSVTSIGPCAFTGCEKLKKVIFPTSLEEIGENAFTHCNFELLDFSKCTALKEIDFTNFSTNKNTKVIFPASLEEIKGKDLYKDLYIEQLDFSRCTALKKIDGIHFMTMGKVIFPASLEVIGDRTFNSGDLVQVDFSRCTSLKKINDSAFSSCKKLSEIVLPDSLTFIGRSAFEDCYELKKVILPASLVEIGEKAFCDCRKLNQIDFSRCTSLKKINDSAFEYCYELKKVILPASLVEIGEDAFRSCNLQRITLPASLEEIGSCAFGSNELESIDMSKVTKLKTIPKNFCGVEKQLVIPQGVITIEKEAILSGKELFLPASLKRYKDNYHWPIIYLFASDFNLESILWMDDEDADNYFIDYIQKIYVLPQYLKNYINQAKALGYRHADSIILPMPDEYLYFYDN